MKKELVRPAIEQAFLVSGQFAFPAFGVWHYTFPNAENVGVLKVTKTESDTKLILEWIDTEPVDTFLF